MPAPDFPSQRFAGPARARTAAMRGSLRPLLSAGGAICGALLWAGVAVAAPGEAAVDFVATLREMRSALNEVSTQRSAARKQGDKVREVCLYDRQRALAQALESTEAAHLSREAASKSGDAARVRVEEGRASRALELVRSLRSAAEGCVGSQPTGGSRPTSVVVTGPGTLDDPQPGPSERTQQNPLRLELPSRPNPASMFRPSR